MLQLLSVKCEGSVGCEIFSFFFFNDFRKLIHTETRNRLNVAMTTENEIFSSSEIIAIFGECIIATASLLLLLA